MKHDPIFHTLIVKPLEAVTNNVLLHVSYWLLNFEQPVFQIEAPNASGLYAVMMMFGDETLEIFPAWNKQLRGTNAYHIETRLVPGSKGSEELTQAENLIQLTADETTPWLNALSQSLTAVEVYGIRNCPQLILFVFASIKIIVSIGYSGDSPLIGDGDEILVFSNDQWQGLKKTLPEDWTKIWERGV